MSASEQPDADDSGEDTGSAGFAPEADAGTPPDTGPEEDFDVPVEAHLEEMLYRLASVIVIAGAVTLLMFPLAEHAIDYLWQAYLPDAAARIYSPLALKLTEVKLASLVGLLVAIPTVVYQFYLFSRPGLYPRERRYYLAAVPTSFVFAVVGVLFAHLLVLPSVLTYFEGYTKGVAETAFGLTRTFELILSIFGFFALIFQIPVVISLALMLGVVTRRWLATRRFLFWAVFGGAAFLFSPDPTGIVPIVVALTMIGLFEGTLLAAKWADR